MSELNDETVEHIARFCHEINRGLCEALDDESQTYWEQAPDWQKKSVCSGVRAIASGTTEDPGDSHEAWRKFKELDGWCHGPTKDPEMKTHPNLVPFEELPVEQQLKDHLFVTTVKTLLAAQS